MGIKLRLNFGGFVKRVFYRMDALKRPSLRWAYATFRIKIVKNLVQFHIYSLPDKFDKKQSMAIVFGSYLIMEREVNAVMDRQSGSLLSLKNDFVFMLMFGDENRKDLPAAFLSAIQMTNLNVVDRGEMCAARSCRYGKINAAASDREFM
jgi:hypothetical protein